MQEFAVVDLIGQAEAIERHTQGWSLEAIIAWLNTVGQVTAASGDRMPTAYIFESSIGLQAAFWFTPDGHLTITPREH